MEIEPLEVNTLSNEISINDVNMPNNTTTPIDASNSDSAMESGCAALQPSARQNAESHLQTRAETLMEATTTGTNVAPIAANLNSDPKQHIDDTSTFKDHCSEAMQRVDPLKSSSLFRGPMTPPGEPVASVVQQTNPAPNNNHPTDENCVSSSGDVVVAANEMLNPAEPCSDDVMIPASSSASMTSPEIVDRRHVESNIPVSVQKDVLRESTRSQSQSHEYRPNSALPSSTTTTTTTMTHANSESKVLSSASPSNSNSIITSDVSHSFNATKITSVQTSSNCRESEGEMNGIDPAQKSSDHIEPSKNDKAFNESREVHDAKRKFRIVGLTFPGKWMNHERLMEIFVKSESFHIWFDKAEKGGIKSGGVSVVFENAEEAKMAFGNLQKMTLDGAPFKLQASRHFYVVLGGYILFMQFEIVFRSADEANDARIELADGFEIDEGDRQSTMVLLTAEEYLAYMKEASEKLAAKAVYAAPSTSQRVPSSSSSSNRQSNASPSQTALLSPRSADNNLFSHSTPIPTTLPQNIPSSSDNAVVMSTDSHPTNAPPPSIQQSTASIQFTPAPEMTVEDVCEYLQKYIDETRINWGELSEVDELWKICDDVSQEHRGIPDFLLKPALLNILELHQRSLPNHWLRQHVDKLIGMWKPEVQKTKSAPRPNAYILSAVDYTPSALSSSSNPKRYSQQTDAKKRTLAMMMGMGAMLNAARSKLVTEEGEVDIDEDEYGNYTIDGQPLTFDSWAELTKQPTESSAPTEAPAPAAKPMMMIAPKYRKIRFACSLVFR
ncbi:unnamed protein product [Anisakis simplex]|uniref:RRM domain-containing protein n=1 Tax=Anisakis simplex TaxID=6269 RepID=A0A158PPR8_ANISI|nr:unnamed protein product [Anisakis simplex]